MICNVRNIKNAFYIKIKIIGGFYFFFFMGGANKNYELKMQ